MTNDERAEAAEQSRITEHEANRAAEDAEFVAAQLAEDYVMQNGQEAGLRRMDFWTQFAKAASDPRWARRYNLLATAYDRAVHYIRNTRIVDETQEALPFDEAAA